MVLFKFAFPLKIQYFSIKIYLKVFVVQLQGLIEKQVPEHYGFWILRNVVNGFMWIASPMTNEQVITA